MSNGNVFERLWKLQATANKLVIDGNRDPEQLCELYQKFIEVNRITFTVTGTGLTSKEWIARLESKGHLLTDYVRGMLSKSDYNAKHRLEVGRECKIVLVRGKEICKDSRRTTTNLKALARSEFGDQSVEELKGELALLIREKLSNAELEQMGLLYIAVLHEPIAGFDCPPSVLELDRKANSSWVLADYDSPNFRWNDDGAFAFLESALD